MICGGSRIFERLASATLLLLLCVCGGCFESALACASDVDCFVGEVCSAGTCRPVMPDGPLDMGTTPVKDLGSDAGPDASSIPEEMGPTMCDEEQCAAQGGACDILTDRCEPVVEQMCEDEASPCEEDLICQDGRCVVAPPPTNLVDFKVAGGSDVLTWTVLPSSAVSNDEVQYVYVSSAVGVFTRVFAMLVAHYRAELGRDDVLACSFDFYLCRSSIRNDLLEIEDLCRRAGEAFATDQQVDRLGVVLVPMQLVGSLSVQSEPVEISPDEPFLGTLFFSQTCPLDSGGSTQELDDTLLRGMRLELSVETDNEQVRQEYPLVF